MSRVLSKIVITFLVTISTLSMGQAGTPFKNEFIDEIRSSAKSENLKISRIKDFKITESNIPTCSQIKIRDKIPEGTNNYFFEVELSTPESNLRERTGLVFQLLKDQKSLLSVSYTIDPTLKVNTVPLGSVTLTNDESEMKLLICQTLSNHTRIKIETIVVYQRVLL